MDILKFMKKIFVLIKIILSASTIEAFRLNSETSADHDSCWYSILDMTI